MTPDPDFYFEGRGHRRAFAYVRYAVLEGESFVVLTGETGVGKTTVVHKLLKATEPEPIVSALLSGTHLDPFQLLAALVAALRANVTGESLDELRAGLQAFLTTVTASGRRALIVVDEAQHLSPDAIQELIMLATLQSRRDSPLQVLLVGQPELRTKLASMPSDALREPVFLFCDLGRLSPFETRSYIEHRLRHVEWERSPLFSNEAHERIYEATDGVPRRINRLCDRLLTAAFQQQSDEVSAEMVRQVDDELRSELGDLATSDDDAENALQPDQATEQNPDTAGSAIEGAPAILASAAPVPGPFEAAASDRVEATPEANRPARHSADATKRALVGATALVFASLFAWAAYEYQNYSGDQRLSSLAEATRAVSGKVVASPEQRAATMSGAAIETKPSIPVPTTRAESTGTVATPDNSTAPTPVAPTPAAGALDVGATRPADTAAAAPTDAARVGQDSQESPKGEVQSSRAARPQLAARLAKPRTSRRNVATAVNRPEPTQPSEPRLQAAPPRPVPGPCNAAVVALGLCTP